MRRLRRLRAELPPLALTVTLVLVTWVLTYRIYAPADFAHPIEFFGDTNYSLGMVKSYADRGLGSLWGAPNPWLGAPGEARWSDFPVSEDVVFFGVGLLSHLTGAIAAMNLGYLGGGLLAAAAMYLVARRLRIAAPLASLIGALFAATPYYFYCTVQHFNLMVYWHLSLDLLVMLWVLSRRGLRVGERRFWLACAIGTLTGLHNAYYLNYLMQVLLLAAVVQAVRREWKAARATAGIMGAGVLGFFLGNLDTLLDAVRFGTNPGAVARSVGDTLIYGLRPIELFVPPYMHHVQALAGVGATYQATAPMLGEFPGNYLGVIPGIGFVAMVLAAFAAILGTGRRGTATRLLVASLWLTFVSIGGGLMQMAQMALGVVAFRSNNRVSILLLGMGLLYLGRALGPRVRALPAQVAWGLVLPVIVFGLWEQAPDMAKKTVYGGGRNHWQMRELWAREADADERFVAGLEGLLPAGAGVLQLPAYVFPENGAIGPVYDYTHFRLYAHSHQKLRWSYGAMKGRPGSTFQHEMARLPPQQMVPRLREAGFGAVVFANPAYAPNTAQLFAEQAGVEVQVLQSDTGDWSAVVFAP